MVKNTLKQLHINKGNTSYSYVKKAARSDEPTDNYHLTLRISQLRGVF